MCTGAEIGLLVTALSGTASAINTNQSLRRQDREAAAGIVTQGNIQREANQRVGQQIDEVAANTGTKERAESLEGFLDSLRAAKGSTEGSLQPINAANPRFAERVSGGKETLRGEGLATSKNLSIIDGILRMRQAEASRFDRTAGDLNELGRQSSGQDFITRLRVAGERPNALIAALADIGIGVGSAVGLRTPPLKIDGAAASKFIGTPKSVTPFSRGVVG